MHPKSLLITSLIMSFALAGTVSGEEAEEVKIYARGDYAKVIEILEPRYGAATLNIQQRLILARAYLHLGRAEDALRVFKSVLETDRENPEAHRLIGKILLQSNKYQEALEHLKHAFRLKQDAATAGALGQCYYARGEMIKAKVYLEKAASQDIRDPNNSLVLGQICLDRGLGALAEKYLLMAQEAGMSSATLHLSLGRAYLLQRKHTGPILVRGLSSKAKPGDVVDDYVVLREIQGTAKRYLVCTRYCVLYEGLRLLEIEPESSDAQFMLATGWLSAGNRDLASKHLELLLTGEDNSPRAVDLQVRLLLSGKNYVDLERALDAAKDAKIFEGPKVADFFYRAATMRRAEGNRKEAIRLLSKAEKDTPTSAKILRSLASLYLGSGQYDQARQYYARLVELFPDAEDIDELSNTLRVLKEKTGGQI